LLFGAIAVLWLVAGVRLLLGMAKVPRLVSVAPLPDADCPFISILVAARDEAGGLRQAIPSLLAQDYPNYEVIVVNDRSRDATPQILEEFARQHQNLKVLQVSELPKGWLGKSHALTEAYKQAGGDWLAFTDADVHLAPDLLRRAMALVQEKRWDHLSVLYFLELAGLWEKAIASFWFLWAILRMEPWRVSNPKSRRYSGSGAFQLLGSSAYEAIGTHQFLAMETAEDFKLGKLAKQAGFHSGVALSDELVRVRWYKGLPGVVRGFTKNAFGACRYRLSILALYLSLLLVFHVLPYLALGVASGMVRAWAAITVLVVLFLRLRTDPYYRVSPFYAFTHPLAAILFLYLMLRSAFVILRQRGLVWRDTFYPLDQLRKGSV